MIEKQANSPTPMKGEEDWIIDVLLYGLEGTSPKSPGWSICKVPRKLRSVNDDACTPHIVSVGPIHHEDEKLLAMEDHKRLYLLSLFNRTQKPHEQMLKDCWPTISVLDADVRACYAEPISYDKNQLAKILLHDAGFLLELFFRYHERDSRIVQNDPIFRTPWIELELRRDLALLENQIPFFVLESLFEHIVRPDAATAGLPPLKLKELALQLFKCELNISKEASRKKCKKRGNHLLHLLYNYFLPPQPYPVDSGRSMRKWEIIHCATSLDQAGVKFQRSTTNDLFDLQFQNGTFKIPRLLIEGSTDSLFRNLVAFEQSVPDSKHYITSYIILMDRLIDTTKDVHLLQQKRIIENNLGGGGDVTHLFNNISKQIVLNDFYFAGLCDKVNAYDKSPWHRRKVALRLQYFKIRDYFKIPWSTTSFLAAVTLLVLTFLQTLFSLLSYYRT